MEGVLLVFGQEGGGAVEPALDLLPGWRAESLLGDDLHQPADSQSVQHGGGVLVPSLQFGHRDLLGLLEKGEEFLLPLREADFFLRTQKTSPLHSFLPYQRSSQILFSLHPSPVPHLLQNGPKGGMSLSQERERGLFSLPPHEFPQDLSFPRIGERTGQGFLPPGGEAKGFFGPDIDSGGKSGLNHLSDRLQVVLGGPNKKP